MHHCNAPHNAPCNALCNALQEHLASFYLDPYARPEDKRGGAWMGVCLGKSGVLDRKPVAYLTCNGSPPIEGQPSLMTFSEVSTRSVSALHALCMRSASALHAHCVRSALQLHCMCIACALRVHCVCIACACYQALPRIWAPWNALCNPSCIALCNAWCFTSCTLLR